MSEPLHKMMYRAADTCLSGVHASLLEQGSAKIELFLAALRNIARQELSSETEIEDPDYLYGYDVCVTIARAAIANELWPQHEAGKTTGVVEIHERCSTEQPATPLIAQKHP